ncbi:hypothetical protein [Aeromonas caviae]|uniref:hypothetical protein n=1 Tax=Aeromonas caviae TaxID=648 RepID=UPI001E56B209|nr:hypothetical protein [Aeromonas caviae]
MAKVLIVDDHPAIRMAVNMLLKQEEHHVLGEVDNGVDAMEGANKRGNSSRLTQSFHFFMFEPIFSPVNALNQPI